MPGHLQQNVDHCKTPLLYFVSISVTFAGQLVPCVNVEDHKLSHVKYKMNIPVFILMNSIIKNVTIQLSEYNFCDHTKKYKCTLLSSTSIYFKLLHILLYKKNQKSHQQINGVDL